MCLYQTTDNRYENINVVKAIHQKFSTCYNVGCHFPFYSYINISISRREWFKGCHHAPSNVHNVEEFLPRLGWSKDYSSHRYLGWFQHNKFLEVLAYPGRHNKLKKYKKMKNFCLVQSWHLGTHCPLSMLNLNFKNLLESVNLSCKVAADQLSIWEHHNSLP